MSINEAPEEPVISQKSAFCFSIFYHALLGLIGRKPNQKHLAGLEGFYHFRFVPQNETEQKSFAKHAKTIRAWMDNFELKEHSRCTFGEADLPHQPGEIVLEVVIFCTPLAQ